ncbi:MAG: hypothetical protein KDB14_17195 [Planctomycetales bacterium]|nr:hypothetical protein [Planctomycetales bacterium]
MSAPTPHFLLYSDTEPPSEDELGRWKFVLRASDGASRLEATDYEKMSRSRLELLSVIRGLEALDQPSRVTLVTSSRYVGQGLRHGLELWRQTDFQWDRFGVMSPIKNEDLWRRLDQVLEYHTLECRVRTGVDVPVELVKRFRVDSGNERIAKSRAGQSLPPAPQRDADTELSRQASCREDRHWPRRKRSWPRVAAAVGTAAATWLGVVLARG